MMIDDAPLECRNPDAEPLNRQVLVDRRQKSEDMASTTLRLTMPQWQGGDEPAYRFGSHLLNWLAPPHDGPEETIDVPEADGTSLEVENGIKGRMQLLTQARTAREAIDAHDPDRIVALGGDCLIDLAPTAYLNEQYDGTLGVLWVDAHPDVTRPEQSSHAHAHVLAMLLGEGDPEFTAEVKTPLDPNKVMIAGMDEWSETEDEIISGLGLQHVSITDVADDSKPVLNWIEDQEITHLAVHFDLDVLDPAHFSPLLFNKPDLPDDTFDGIPRGKMRLDQVVRLLTDVGAQTDIVGLAITEHLPWDMLRLSEALGELPILRNEFS